MVASWRAPQETSFRPNFLDQTLTKQPIVVQNSMKKHLREMSNMICELKDTGHVLTDE